MSESSDLFTRARSVIPGGVNSPVRACRSVGQDPVFIASGAGARVTDVDGNEYIDMISSWGPLILGHAHPEILAAARDAMAKGPTFGAPTELEVRFAETIVRLVPSIEKVRAVSSGTEATMSALRLARGFTGRDLIVKADGGYHGHADFLLVAAGSGAATLGIPGSKGVPAGAAQDTLLVPYNDLNAATRLFEKHGDRIAAVIIEPIAGNMGVVPPGDGYLQGLRALTENHGALLIFDEVITGFRASLGGAQELYGVMPDLTCLGKIIGGGFPAAAFGGRADIMDAMAPDGEVYQAGTLSGNPVAMAAGLATMKLLESGDVHATLDARGEKLARGLLSAAAAAGVTACLNRVGSAMTLFFAEGPITDYASAKSADTQRYGRFYAAMRDRGVFLAPSQFEAMFVSMAHTDDDIDQVIARAGQALGAIA